MPQAAPNNIKKGLESACQKAADEIAKLAPGEKTEKKVAEILGEKVCKDVDKKILTLIAEELAKQGKKHSAKAPPNTPPKLDAVPTLKKPGSGSPSLTIPLPEIDLGGDAKGKFELQLWGDPKQFDDPKKDKGAMVYFTVKF